MSDQMINCQHGEPTEVYTVQALENAFVIAPVGVLPLTRSTRHVKTTEGQTDTKKVDMNGVPTATNVAMTIIEDDVEDAYDEHFNVWMESRRTQPVMMAIDPWFKDHSLILKVLSRKELFATPTVDDTDLSNAEIVGLYEKIEQLGQKHYKHEAVREDPTGSIRKEFKLQLRKACDALVYRQDDNGRLLRSFLELPDRNYGNPDYKISALIRLIRSRSIAHEDKFLTTMESSDTCFDSDLRNLLIQIHMSIAGTIDKLYSHRKYDQRPVNQMLYESLSAYSRINRGRLSADDLTEIVMSGFADKTLGSLKLKGLKNKDANAIRSKISKTKLFPGLFAQDEMNLHSKREFLDLYMNTLADQVPHLTLTWDMRDSGTVFFRARVTDPSTVVTIKKKYQYNTVTYVDTPREEHEHIEEMIDYLHLKSKAEAILPQLSSLCNCERHQTQLDLLVETSPVGQTLVQVDIPHRVFYAGKTNTPTRFRPWTYDLYLHEKKIAETMFGCQVDFRPTLNHNQRRLLGAYYNVKSYVKKRTDTVREDRKYIPALHRPLYQSRIGLNLSDEPVYNRWGWTTNHMTGALPVGIEKFVESEKTRAELTQRHVTDWDRVLNGIIKTAIAQTLPLYGLSLDHPFINETNVRKLLSLEVLEFAVSSKVAKNGSPYHRKNGRPLVYAIFRNVTQEVKVRSTISTRIDDVMKRGNFEQMLVETNAQVWPRIAGGRLSVNGNWNEHDLKSIRHAARKKNSYANTDTWKIIVGRAIAHMIDLMDYSVEQPWVTTKSVHMNISRYGDRSFQTTYRSVKEFSIERKFDADAGMFTLPVFTVFRRDLQAWIYDQSFVVAGTVNRRKLTASSSAKVAS